MAGVALEQVIHPDDPRLAALSRLLNQTFPDPNSVLGLDRIQEFLTANAADGPRHFCVLVASRNPPGVIGGTIFSYVQKSNCGFSEYLVLDRAFRAKGLGRGLFERRKAILDALAGRHAQAACRGLFIEVDNPHRTPAELAKAERETSLEATERLRLFEHLGFRRVDIAYVQPALAADKAPVNYLDLLFAAWDAGVAHLGRIPSEWIVDTVEAIWSAWTPKTYARHLADLRDHVRGTKVDLVDPLAGLRAK